MHSEERVTHKVCPFPVGGVDFARVSRKGDRRIRSCVSKSDDEDGLAREIFRSGK
jgi:hypothetical protein